MIRVSLRLSLVKKFVVLVAVKCTGYDFPVGATYTPDPINYHIFLI